MRKTSLASAKAHLSALVDAARNRGEATLILRHGKPAAALVPADAVLTRRRPRRRRRTAGEIGALFAAFGPTPPSASAVAELERTRR